jgi:lipase chaperone LimK
LADRTTRRARRTAAGLVAFGLLCVLWLAGGERDAGETEGRPPGKVGAPLAASPAQPGLPSEPAATGENDPVVARARGLLPRSLRGTDVDGGLAVSEDGAFVPTPDAIELFEYFLAASGEESLEVIRQRIVDHIRSQLQGEAARDAEALLDDYLAFREELRELVEAQEAPGDLERRLLWTVELRRKHFSPAVADALFRAEEDTLWIDLERRRVATDASLDPDERRARLAALEEQLPESVREARSRARAPRRVRAEVAAIRAAGASEADVFALRERYFGTDAAERLATLDSQQVLWAQRLDAYRLERDDLLASGRLAELSQTESEAALDELRHEHFDASEVIRVRAMDHFDR